MSKPILFLTNSMKTALGLFVAMSCLGAVSPAIAAKTLIDYFLPTPIHDHLRSDVWGVRPSARATSRTASKMPP